MKVSCPKCETPYSIPKDRHYSMITCGNCGEEFQATSKMTTRLAEEFVAKVIARAEGSDPSKS